MEDNNGDDVPVIRQITDNKPCHVLCRFTNNIILQTEGSSLRGSRYSSQSLDSSSVAGERRHADNVYGEIWAS